MTVSTMEVYAASVSYEAKSGVKVEEGGAKSENQKPITLRFVEKVEQFEKDIVSQLMDILKKIGEEMNNELLKMGVDTKGVANGESLRVSMSEMNVRTVNLEVVVAANDGKLNKNVEINFEESFMSQTNINFSKEMSAKQKLLDPIVINFDGNGVELSDKKFAFDLDSDGREDQISMLKKGSGYLVLDKNNDGKINDGSELFGTKSGDGYKDLEIYDKNGDGKIDINDAIYDKLRIWKKDDSGEDKLIGLGEVGIGVIYLDPKELRSNLYDSSGNLSGIAQKSSNVLFTDGRMGNSYHLDLVAV